MASQHGQRFVSPAYNRSFQPSNFNVNPIMERPPRPQFQIPPISLSGSLQIPEASGIHNRPQFSNFPGSCDFLNRPPPPVSACNSFPVPANSNSYQPFSSASNSLSPSQFSSQPPTLSQPSFPPRSPAPSPLSHHPPDTSNPPPPLPQSNFSTQSPFSLHNNRLLSIVSPQQNQYPNMPVPPQHNQPTNMSVSPQHNQPSNMPILPQNNQPPNVPVSPQHNQPPNMSVSPQFHPPNMPVPPQFNHPPNMPVNAQHNRPPNISVHPLRDRPPNILVPPQHNQSHNMPMPSQHHQFPNMSVPAQHNTLSNIAVSGSSQQSVVSHSQQQNQFRVGPYSHKQQGYHSNSLSPSRGHQFDNAFQRPYRSWNQISRFNGPRTPFSSQSPNVLVKSHQFRNSPQQGNKKKKEKSREFRKLKSWMTDELFAEVKKKNALYLKAKSSDEQTAWQEFRLQRNRVSSLIKEAKIKAGLITRKVKEDDSTEKPYSCDTCDRAFVTENELSVHLSQHIKCDYENCTFEAHPKIVLLHKKMQHETGYAERISKLKDDAEVKKWREERRKRFPTAENIRKRQAEQAEKLARGEVLETKEFGKFKRKREENGDLAHGPRKRMRGHHRHRNHSRRNFHNNHSGFQQFKVNSESDSDSDSHISLNMFCGLSSLANSAKNMCHNDEIIKLSSSEQNLPKSISNVENHFNASYSENNFDKDTISPDLSNENVLGNTKTPNESVLEIPEDEIEKPQKPLIVIEDSDDEGPEVVAINKSHEEMLADKNSDDEGPEVVPVNKCQEDVDDKGPEVVLINKHQEEMLADKNNDEVPEIVAINKSKEKTSNDNSNYSKRQRIRKESNFTTEQYNRSNQNRRTSLLEKLLADDIRHERNVILQCMRHIVNNNFFGLAVKKS